RRRPASTRFPYTTLFRSVEKLFIPLDLPAAVFEWSAPDGAELRVEWTTAPWPASPDSADAPAALRWRRHGRALIARADAPAEARSEEHTSELQSRENLVC